MKKLPLGIQTFRKIIEEKKLYIDKTKDIHRLIESGQIYFLSRPRRFGKSLLVSTLKEIFLGSRELFKGLYIYDKIEWQSHPVIHIDFSVVDYNDGAQLEKSLITILDRLNRTYELALKKESLKGYFEQIVRTLSQKMGNKVVVLIDEYDKPIIDFMTEPDKAKENRNVLQNFFSVLKGVDQYIRFVFMTGVSKFSKVSIFSGLNNLLDITLDSRFSTMLGITEDELSSSFAPYIKTLAEAEDVSIDKLKGKLKHWYNGYSWDGVNKVYNPTSLLTLFTRNRFGNYWFATGTPTFLVSSIKERQMDISGIERKKVGEYIFDSFDIDKIDLYSLLFQTGYLTVSKAFKKREILQYELDFPNFEVKESLLNYLLAAYSGKETAEIQPLYLELIDCLEEKKTDRFMTLLTSLFAEIPYNLHIKSESYYPGRLGEQQAMLATSHSLCYMVLTLMGAKIDLEVLTDKGRVDAVLILDELIYVIEFKMGRAKDALAQIKERRYYEQFLRNGKEVLLLGVGGFGEKKPEYCLEAVPIP